VRGVSINPTVRPHHNVPNSAQAYQRNARCWHSTSLAYLVKQRSTMDKVSVTGERYEARRLWRSLGTL
jgi:hypothetical protein